MAPLPRRLIALGAAVVAVPLLAALPIGSAAAAAKTVVVGSSAFTPASLPMAPKDSVAFKNGTGTVITLSFSSNWPGSPNPEPVPIGGTSTRRTLTAVGTYTVSATGVGVSSNGKVVVKKPVAKPTGTPAPRPSATTPPPASPHPSASVTPPAAPPSASASATTTRSAGPGGSSSPAATVSAAASSSGIAVPTNAPPALAGRSKTALIQTHLIRRLGLPGAVSAVLVLALILGLGRVLLAMAPRRAPAD